MSSREGLWDQAASDGNYDEAAIVSAAEEAERLAAERVRARRRNTLAAYTTTEGPLAHYTPILPSELSRTDRQRLERGELGP
jgi:hypothetical protein